MRHPRAELQGVAEAARSGVRPETDGALPPQLRHEVRVRPGGGLRRHLRKDLPNHVQEAGLQRDRAKVLQTPRDRQAMNS